MTLNGKLYATHSARSLGAEIARHLGMALHETTVERFVDGELFVKFNESVRGEIIFLVSRIHMPYEHLFELLMTVDAARRSSAREVVLVIPYLPHSRQERRDGQRTAVTSRLVADLIQSVGADRLITLDLHTDAIEGFYKIPVDALSFRSTFIEHLEAHPQDGRCFCSPDFGGIKRVRPYAKHFRVPMVVMNKERLEPNAVARMEIIGEVSGKNVIIIDDMVDTAGTLCKAADLLMDCGANSVCAYCTHGLLSGDALATINYSKLERLYVTDTVTDRAVPEKIHILPSAKLLANAIARQMQSQH